MFYVSKPSIFWVGLNSNITCVAPNKTPTTIPRANPPLNNAFPFLPSDPYTKAIAKSLLFLIKKRSLNGPSVAPYGFPFTIYLVSRIYPSNASLFLNSGFDAVHRGYGQRSNQSGHEPGQEIHF